VGKLITAFQKLSWLSKLISVPLAREPVILELKCDNVKDFYKQPENGDEWSLLRSEKYAA